MTGDKTYTRGYIWFILRKARDSRCIPEAVREAKDKRSRHRSHPMIRVRHEQEVGNEMEAEAEDKRSNQ